MLLEIKTAYDNQQSHKLLSLRRQYKQEMQVNIYQNLGPIIKPRQPPLDHLIIEKNEIQTTLYKTNKIMQHFWQANHSRFNQSEGTLLTNRWLQHIFNTHSFTPSILSLLQGDTTDFDPHLDDISLWFLHSFQPPKNTPTISPFITPS